MSVFQGLKMQKLIFLLLFCTFPAGATPVPVPASDDPVSSAPAPVDMTDEDLQQPVRQTVAIISTGFNYKQGAIAAPMAINYGEVPNDGIDNDRNGNRDDYLGFNTVEQNGAVNDNDGRGTALMESILAQTLQTNHIQFLPVRVTDENGVATRKSIVAGVDYAIKRRADIIVLPFANMLSFQESCDVLARAAIHKLTVFMLPSQKICEPANTVTVARRRNRPAGGMVSLAAGQAAETAIGEVTVNKSESDEALAVVVATAARLRNINNKISMSELKAILAGSVYRASEFSASVNDTGENGYFDAELAIKRVQQNMKM